MRFIEQYLEIGIAKTLFPLYIWSFLLKPQQSIVKWILPVLQVRQQPAD
jgi:hypothetical protein